MENQSIWVSSGWKDYALLDCSDGERLERWGEYILIRPDPQVIWRTPKTHPGWNKYHGRYERSASGGGKWIKKNMPEKWSVKYGGLTFWVGPMNFKHTGVFPEQAVNWDFIRQRVKSSERPLNILNLFAYTGAATLAAAEAGAGVCHVDAAKGMVSWARDNARASGLQDKPVRWIVDDCAKFLEKEIRRGKTYDAIIMDPPSYGRGPSGEIWKLETSLYPFLELCVRALSDNPSFIIINSYTTGLAPSVLKYLLDTVVTPRFGGLSSCRELGLPVENNKLVLPCGSVGRWVSDES